ncbi:ABC transporter permease [Anaeromicropila populeti]|uniref:Peptide/nickel transport system permease protein n=1 Tax=Anaeromicropila populeti TaxID=37658 RepID=A0A1I6HUF2_9FIRM|nr:ABC transporter permease [Anaeromicropila populeti]SFR58037.1 peptide/nickel transport system permease protein [Anaeromicropila populeti]
MKFAFQKAGTLMITLFIISIVTFFAFQVIPGDSATANLGIDASPEQVEALREQYGLNKSLLERYGEWAVNALRGDFGTSFSYRVPVRTLIGERLPVTLMLGMTAILIILAASAPLGILAARWDGRLPEKLITIANQIGMAIPSFFLGMIISLVFGVILKWFIPGQYVGFSENPGGFFRYLIFPAAAIAIPKTAMLVKFLHNSIVRQLGMEYVRTARSKGNSEHQILYRHAFQNALLPVITFLAIIIMEVLANSIIIEQVFSVPGMGRLLVAAISNRDFPVVQAIVLYIAIVVILLNGLVDLLYHYIDPRVKTL